MKGNGKAGKQEKQAEENVRAGESVRDERASE